VDDAVDAPLIHLPILNHAPVAIFRGRGPQHLHCPYRCRVASLTSIRLLPGSSREASTTERTDINAKGIEFRGVFRACDAGQRGQVRVVLGGCG
jgi:hypothetical protein